MVAVAGAIAAVAPVLHVHVRRAGGGGAAAELGQVALGIGGRAAQGFPRLELERRRSSAAFLARQPEPTETPPDGGLGVAPEALR